MAILDEKYKIMKPKEVVSDWLPAFHFLAVELWRCGAVGKPVTPMCFHFFPQTTAVPTHAPHPHSC